MVKRVSVSDLKPGDILAEPVRLENRISLLESGTTLKETYIQKLKKLGIKHVGIQIKSPDGIEEQKGKTSATYARQHKLPAHVSDNKKASHFHQYVHEQILSDRKMTHPAVPSFDSRYQYRFKTIIGELMKRPAVFDGLNALYWTDPYLFHHSLNVAVLSGLIGMARDYDEEELSRLISGALLFDIGMTLVPADLIRRNDSLKSEELEMIRSHTVEGYHFLVKCGDISREAARCALEHHERYDGSGYPYGLMHEQIHEYAKIVSIADVFDALISPRPHREPYTVNEAMEFLYASGNSYFDFELVRVLLNQISIYSIATIVRLNSGQVGVVVSTRPGLTHRPVVKIIREANGMPADPPYEVNLMTERNLIVEEVIHP